MKSLIGLGILLVAGCAGNSGVGPGGVVPDVPDPTRPDPEVCFSSAWVGDTLNVDVKSVNAKRTIRAAGVDIGYEGLTYVDVVNEFGTFDGWVFGGQANGVMARMGTFTTAGTDSNGVGLGGIDLPEGRKKLYRVRFVEGPGENKLNVDALWDDLRGLGMCATAWGG